MLPQFFRIIAINNSGQIVNFDTGLVNLKMTGWIINPSTGKIAYTPIADDDMSFDGDENWAVGGELKSDEFDNKTSVQYIGMQVQLEVTHDLGTAATGTFDIYLDGGDATGELASDASGYNTAEANVLEQVGSLTWESNGANNEVMRSSVIEIGG